MHKKEKKLLPVVNDRQQKVEAATQKLVAVRQRKITIVAQMRESQKQYMEGVDRLNQERGSLDRHMLDPLERGLDSIKNHWMELYRQVVACEQEEKDRVDELTTAYKDVEAVKALTNKYQLLHQKDLARVEQRQSDEIASRRHQGQRR